MLDHLNNLINKIIIVIFISVIPFSVFAEEKNNELLEKGEAHAWDF